MLRTLDGPIAHTLRFQLPTYDHCGQLGSMIVYEMSYVRDAQSPRVETAPKLPALLCCGGASKSSDDQYILNCHDGRWKHGRHRSFCRM